MRAHHLYHLTHSTPRLLELAAERFAAAGRQALAAWARVRAREESHQDLLALRDLAMTVREADIAAVEAILPLGARASTSRW